MDALKRRKFTDDEKQKIVNEASMRGINVVLQEHRLSYSVFTRWKKKFCIADTNKIKTDPKVVQQLNALVIENERLKKIIANQALEIQIKAEKLNEK